MHLMLPEDEIYIYTRCTRLPEDMHEILLDAIDEEEEDDYCDICGFPLDECDCTQGADYDLPDAEDLKDWS